MKEPYIFETSGKNLKVPDFSSVPWWKNEKQIRISEKQNPVS